jgi:hypothetical protein
MFLPFSAPREIIQKRDQTYTLYTYENMSPNADAQHIGTISDIIHTWYHERAQHPSHHGLPGPRFSLVILIIIWWITLSFRRSSGLFWFLYFFIYDYWT